MEAMIRTKRISEGHDLSIPGEFHCAVAGRDAPPWTTGAPGDSHRLDSREYPVRQR